MIRLVHSRETLYSALCSELEREGLTEEDIRWEGFYDPMDEENPPPEFTFMNEHIPFKTPTLYAWTGDTMWRVDGDAVCMKRKSYDNYPVIFIDHKTYNPFAGVEQRMTFDVPIKEAL